MNSRFDDNPSPAFRAVFVACWVLVSAALVLSAWDQYQVMVEYNYWDNPAHNEFLRQRIGAAGVAVVITILAATTTGARMALVVLVSSIGLVVVGSLVLFAFGLMHGGSDEGRWYYMIVPLASLYGLYGVFAGIRLWQRVAKR